MRCAVLTHGMALAAEVKGDGALPAIAWKCGGKPCVGDEPINASAPSPSKADILYDGHTLQVKHRSASQT